MNIVMRASLVGLFLCLPALSLKSQEPPKNDRHGNSISIVRNDASTAVTIETRVNGQWQALKIDPSKDASIPGDHIRIATTRADGAVVSIDFPIEAGKKYRVFWNEQAHMWDIANSL
jgi:hypothetical protein